MKLALEHATLPDNSLLLLCSSQEDRFRGALYEAPDWRPRGAILFRYDAMSAQGARNHATVASYLRQRTVLVEARLSEIVGGRAEATPLTGALRETRRQSGGTRYLGYVKSPFIRPPPMAR